MQTRLKLVFSLDFHVLDSIQILTWDSPFCKRMVVGGLTTGFVARESLVPKRRLDHGREHSDILSPYFSISIAAFMVPWQLVSVCTHIGPTKDVR